jgi:hypothetical protein
VLAHTSSELLTTPSAVRKDAPEHGLQLGEGRVKPSQVLRLRLILRRARCSSLLRLDSANVSMSRGTSHKRLRPYQGRFPSSGLDGVHPTRWARPPLGAPFHVDLQREPFDLHLAAARYTDPVIAQKPNSCSIRSHQLVVPLELSLYSRRAHGSTTSGPRSRTFCSLPSRLIPDASALVP